MSVKCPNCGADIPTDGNEGIYTCKYCGAKVSVYDESEQKYTYRKVDDARIHEADVKEKIRLRELEIEQQKYKSRQRLKQIGLLVAIALTIIGLIMTVASDDLGWGLGINLMLWPWLFYILINDPGTKKDNDDKKRNK